jgi:hypothetical protein
MVYIHMCCVQRSLVCCHRFIYNEANAHKLLQLIVQYNRLYYLSLALQICKELVTRYV